MFKVIPIEGEAHVNGYPQKKAAEMTGEALVALTLSGLRGGGDPGASPGGRIIKVSGVIRRPQ